MKMKSFIYRGLALLGFVMLTTIAFAQNARTVSGKITDTKGEALPGVNVVVEGTTIGTVSTIDGDYQLQVPNPERAVLIFSFMGYQQQKVSVGGSSTVNVTLSEDVFGLDEVVAIGYGVVRKRDLTGAVSSVKAEDIAKTTSSNAMQAMQARVPGLDIQQSDGQAGAGLRMNLRGTRSITASNNPLILVDGVEYGSTLDINPSDIESMEVLKDASSTAIYGTRGANGVIIITTKRGKAGKTVVSINSFLSSNQPTNIPKMMFGQTEVNRRINAERYKRDQKLVAAGTGNWGDTKFEDVKVTEVLSSAAANNLPYAEMDIYNENSYTNWSDIILQNGLTQNYEIAVSGGNEKTNFNVSLGTMYEEGLFRKDELDRYNIKSNIDHKISNAFKVGTSLLFTYKDHNRRTNVLNRAITMTSISNPYDKEGNIILRPSPTYEAHANPLLDEVDGNFQRNIESTRFFGNAYIEVAPVRNILFKSMFALDRSGARDGLYQDYQSVGRLQLAQGSFISVTNDARTNYTWENTLNLNTDFGGSNHSLTGLLGHSMNQNVFETRTVEGRTAAEHYYVSSFYDLRNITVPVFQNNYIKSAMISYFGRINYKYMEKYLLTASLRADGSSVLATGHKWGYFPSVAGAWRLSEESFLKDSKVINNLKLRASWGISGNAAVEPYQTLTTISDFPVYYMLDGKEYSGKIPNSLGNKELTWEKTSSLNFGLDFGILTNRISGSVDVYFSHTNDLLYMKSIPASSVFPQVIANIGETKAQGVEIALNTLVIDTKSFKWDINWSTAFFKDEIVKLSDGLERNISGRTGQIVGQPVTIFYNYEADGCWGIGEFAQYKTDWEARHPGETFGMTGKFGDPGTLKIVDKNDDGKIDDEDKRVYNRSPKAVFGMNNSFTFNNFSLSVLLYARVGGFIEYEYNNAISYEPSNWADLDYWTPENQNAKIPTPGNQTNWGNYGSTVLYEDASYLKIKDISLSYNLPKNPLSKVGIEKVKVFGSLKNFFTFSNIDNYDPERGGSISFPLSKQVVFGLNVEF